MGSEYTCVTNSKVVVSHNTELRCIASLVEFSNSVSGRVPYVTASLDCKKKKKRSPLEDKSLFLLQENH